VLRFNNLTEGEDPMAGGNITVYENVNFAGRSKAFPIGTYRLFTPADFNDVISSIKVPAGLAVIVFADADEGGGYGIWVDLLEDWPDLSKINFNDKISYLNVFSTTTSGGLVWVRNSMQNGQFIPGHWERQRATPPPPNHVPVVGPAIPPHTPPVITSVTQQGAQWVITTLGPISQFDASEWDHANTEQAGVIGSDFRGSEQIGTAAFERASNNIAIPDNLNFWYPQQPARDHRAPFKRTLAGAVKESHVANVNGTFEDHDLNIDIIPNPNYQYLLTDAHAREYTDIMSAQWNLSLHQSGQPNCDDAASKAEFSFVEAEIQAGRDSRAGASKTLNDLIAAHQGIVCVYGPWIYDKGHCCHSEIHPAEQVWWRDELPNSVRKYSLNLICDASRRFWWRDQMDDGTKLKPWGAPPIHGIFAIAFEVRLGTVTAPPGIIFEVANVDDYNVAVIPNANQVYSLTYKGRTLVQFIPHNDAFHVSFERVGLVGSDQVRGFLVLETTVGTLTQKATQAILPGNPPSVVRFPMGTDVDKIDQRFERQIFEKVEGHYFFSVTQRNAPGPVLTT
jgi:hypothetical protein